LESRTVKGSAFLFWFWFSREFVVRRSGVARQPLTFFASPKKVSKERRPRCHCPSGAQLSKTKNGKASKLASLKQRSFLYPFSVLHNWQCQKWMKFKNKVKVNTNGNTNGNTKTISIVEHSFFY